MRYHPSPELAQHVEHYWCVEWDYTGLAPERVEILQHPSVHMVFDSSTGDRILGVTRGRFSTVLEGRGDVFGVKFTPAGFHPFLKSPVSQLSDRTVRVADVFGAAGARLARLMMSRRSHESRIATIEKFLTEHMPAHDENVPRVSEMVYAVATDRTILKVEDLATRYGATTRGLQRLLARYVGVSPKWVIQRYRLHEAAARLADKSVKQTDLALSLGYADQAHFVRDFKAVVGFSPAAYARQMRHGRTHEGHVG